MRRGERDDPDLAQAQQALSELTISLGRYIARQVQAAQAAATAGKTAQTHPDRWHEREHPKLAYGLADAARALSISRATLWRRIKDGQIEAFRFGARTLIRADELRRVTGGDSEKLR